MSGLPVLVALAVGCAAALLAPGRPTLPLPTAGGTVARTPSAGPTGRRRRLLVALLAAGATLAVLPGTVGWVAAVVVGVWLHRATSTLAGGPERRRRAEATADLPVLAELLAGALAAGAPVPRAVDAVCAAWPGAAADRLAAARSRLALGTDAVLVWQAVGEDEVLAPLGRALARSASSGAPVAEVVARLAADLGDRARGDAEDRARTVGVRAAVPLGLCLLPAFVVLGIVPLAAGLLSSLT